MRFPRSSTVPVLALLVLSGLESAAGQAKAPQLPQATGREAVKKVCATCHEIETVIASRRTRIGWERSVEDMIARGAKGTDEELDAVVEYLATYFGKTNVNAASTEELEKSLGLSAKEAQAIAEYRRQNGKIRDFEELKRIPSVNAEKLQTKRSLIAFSL
jgi:competence protein ComEA